MELQAIDCGPSILRDGNFHSCCKNYSLLVDLCLNAFPVSKNFGDSWVIDVLACTLANTLWHLPCQSTNGKRVTICGPVRGLCWSPGVCHLARVVWPLCGLFPGCQLRTTCGDALNQAASKPINWAKNHNCSFGNELNNHWKLKRFVCFFSITTCMLPSQTRNKLSCLIQTERKTNPTFDFVYVLHSKN